MRLLGRAWLEALVLAILLGTMARTCWVPGSRWRAGIGFSAKYLLEGAVVLLGASVSAATVLAIGPAMLLGIAATVMIAILVSLAVGKVLGLPPRMALLIASGNSICGNSAIAAVAPVIGADSDDVAASIAFTAALGVLVVLGLPLIGSAVGMKAATFGAFAGLTVYAVPQVIAATAPFGPTAVQMGTLVKLVRVLMLGPVCLVLSLSSAGVRGGAGPVRGASALAGLSLGHLVPWFIVGFVLMMACRSLGLIPAVAIGPISKIATLLTVVSMAALGLGVDIRSLARSGVRVTGAAVLSLAGLALLAIALLTMLRF